MVPVDEPSPPAAALLYRLLFALLLRRIDAEAAHVLASRTLGATMAVPVVGSALRWLLKPRDPRLQVRALGLTLPTPLGVAAGVDKDASWFESLGALGFGFVEVGTVTARAQVGNARPRVFRLLPERALLNRMGFPNPGAAAVAERLRDRTGRTVVGLNIGKTRVAPMEDAVEDYRASARQLAPVADYVVLNVSSPNTPGLRELQAVERLGRLVTEVQGELRRAQGSVPLLVKVGPDLSDEGLDAIADLATTLKLDGIVAVNTTADREVLGGCRDEVRALGDGGISGAPLKARALAVLRRLRARVGDELVLISVGGIETPDDAWERILAGATLVQSYTGLVYGGPFWPWRMNRGLGRRVREARRSSIDEAVGAAPAPSHGLCRSG